MKKYPSGYVFSRPYGWYDWVLVVLVLCAGAAMAYARGLARIEILPVIALVLVILLYAFRPAYGYLNVRKRIAMNGSLRRLPFERVKLNYEGGTLTVVDSSSKRPFFSVPSLTESQFNELKGSVNQMH